MIRKWVKQGWSLTKICAQFWISRETFLYHCENYMKYGWNDLQ